jgi:N-glycosylase/DNA lyase
LELIKIDNGINNNNNNNNNNYNRDKLILSIEELIKSDVKEIVLNKIKEFESFKYKNNNEWFCELCFCILTANSKASSGISIQNELGVCGFCNYSVEQIRDVIIKHKHRFHNNKSKYILTARKFKDSIKKVVEDIVSNEGIISTRDFIVKNVKGIGYKEASHFLRNVGFFNVAILDRHVLNLLLDYGYIDVKPKSLTRNKYIEIESILQNIADKLELNQAELDMYLWYMKTGTILK